MARLAQRLPAAPLRGPFVDRRGRRRTVSITARDLYGLLRAGDLLAGARAEYPGAIRSAVDGDPAPLLRLEHRFDQLPDMPVPPDAAQTLSFSLFTATLCEEAPLPWDRTAPTDDRLKQARDQAAAIDDSAFLPFDRETALALEPTACCSSACAGRRPPTAPALGPRPAARRARARARGRGGPAHAARGRAQVAARFPQASVVAVPKAGHAVLGQPGAKCAQTVVKRWFAGRPLGDKPCANAHRPARVQALLPATLAAVAPYNGVPGRTLAATLLTLTDLYRERREIAILLDHPRGGGLRSGRWSAHASRLRLERFSLVPGVAVSGVVGDGRHPTGKVTVSGAAALAGTLTLARDGRSDGRYGAGTPCRRVGLTVEQACTNEIARFCRRCLAAVVAVAPACGAHGDRGVGGRITRAWGRKARDLLCPTLTISRPSNMYFERRSSGHLVLRATSSLNNVGRGPIEMHGRRNGPNSMRATQRIYRRDGGHMNVRTGAHLGFKSIPASTATGSSGTPRGSSCGRSTRADGRFAACAPAGSTTTACATSGARTRGRARRAFRTTPGCSQSPYARSLTLGTSVGWSDIYPATYHEQWIDVTGLHGRFRYVMVADPTGVIYTTNTRPPSASRLVTIP